MSELSKHPERLELTNRQKLFWLGQELNPTLPVYDITFYFELFGEISEDRLEAAFESVVARNDALRLGFKSDNGRPSQWIRSTQGVNIERFDFTYRADADREFRDWVATRARQPKQLDDSVFDSALVRLSRDRLIWYLSQHHIATDGWSTALVFQRTAETYAALERGETPPTEPDPSFRVYADRELQSRSSAEFTRAENYRRKKLATETREVSFYRSTPARRSNREVRRTLALGRERTERLASLATSDAMPSQQQHASQFAILSTLLLTYLHRVSGHSEVSLGMVFHNRLTPADEGTCGLFINLFPMQMEITEQDTLRTVIGRSMMSALEAVRYGPHCTSNPGRQRAYDVLLNYLPMSYPDFGDYRAHTHWVHSGASDCNHSLSLHVHDFDGDGDLKLVFDFNTGVFTPDERERALQDFEALFDLFLDAPELPISEVKLVSGEQRAKVSLQPAVDPAPIPRPVASEAAAAPWVALFREILGVEDVSPYDSFFDLGGHSLLAVDLCTLAERRFGTEVPLPLLFSAPTPAALAGALSQPAAETATVVALGDPGPRRALFCVPGAGGHLLNLQDLGRELGGDRSLYGLQARGFGENEAPYEQIEEMAAAYVTEMKKVQPQGPYLLIGTCLGGIIAFEMARQLDEAGESIDFLGLVESYPPDAYPYPKSRGGKLLRMGGTATRELRGLRFKNLVVRGRARLGRLGRDLGATLGGGSRKRASQVARGSVRAATHYRPAAFGGRIHLFQGDNRPPGIVDPPLMGWGELARGGVQVVPIQGRHSSVLRKPHVEVLARQLKAELEAVDLAAAGSGPTKD